MSTTDLDEIQAKLKVAIEEHQTLVSMMQTEPQNVNLQQKLRVVQTDIQNLTQQQKMVVQLVRKELVSKQTSSTAVVAATNGAVSSTGTLPGTLIAGSSMTPLAGGILTGSKPIIYAVGTTTHATNMTGTPLLSTPSGHVGIIPMTMVSQTIPSPTQPSPSLQQQQQVASGAIVQQPIGIVQHQPVGTPTTLHQNNTGALLSTAIPAPHQPQPVGVTPPNRPFYLHITTPATVAKPLNTAQVHLLTQGSTAVLQPAHSQLMMTSLPTSVTTNTHCIQQTSTTQANVSYSIIGKTAVKRTHPLPATSMVQAKRHVISVPSINQAGTQGNIIVQHPARTTQPQNQATIASPLKVPQFHLTHRTANVPAHDVKVKCSPGRPPKNIHKPITASTTAPVNLIVKTPPTALLTSVSLGQSSDTVAVQTAEKVEVNKSSLDGMALPANNIVANSNDHVIIHSVSKIQNGEEKAHTMHSGNTIILRTEEGARMSKVVSKVTKQENNEDIDLYDPSILCTLDAVQQSEKLHFMANLHLITPDTVKDLNCRRTERKRWTTANPQYNNYNYNTENLQSLNNINSSLIMTRHRTKDQLTKKPRPLLLDQPITTQSSIDLNGQDDQNHSSFNNVEKSSNNDLRDVCTECFDGGELLMCDSCDLLYHLSCIKPPLNSVPKTLWSCNQCMDSESKKTANWRGTLALVHAYIAQKQSKEDEKRRQQKHRQELTEQTLALNHRSQQLSNTLQKMVKEHTIVLNRYNESEKSLKIIKNFLQILQNP